MLSEEKTIEIVNKYLQRAHEANIRRSFPVVASKIYSDGQLCERIMDYLGDVYTCAGLDENYEENACGAEIQEAISFIAFFLIITYNVNEQVHLLDLSALLL